MCGQDLCKQQLYKKASQGADSSNRAKRNWKMATLLKSRFKFTLSQEHKQQQQRYILLHSALQHSPLMQTSFKFQQVVIMYICRSHVTNNLLLQIYRYSEHISANRSQFPGKFFIIKLQQFPLQLPWYNTAHIQFPANF